MFAFLALQKKKEKVQLWKQIFDRIDDFAKSNVFFVKKKPEKPIKETSASKKDSLIKKTMSIVNEKDEENSEDSKKHKKTSSSSSSSHEYFEEFHEEIEEMQEIPQKSSEKVQENQFPYHISENYLENLAEKSLKKYAQLKKQLESLGFLLKVKKLQPVFEKIKRVPKKNANFFEEELVAKLEKIDNIGQKHFIEIWHEKNEKNADSLIFKGATGSNLRKKAVEIPKGENLKEFAKKIQENVKISSEKPVFLLKIT